MRPSCLLAQERGPSPGSLRGRVLPAVLAAWLCLPAPAFTTGNSLAKGSSGEFGNGEATSQASSQVVVFDASRNAFGRALGNLDPVRWPRMLAGKRIFVREWAPWGEGKPEHQGLGPLYNASSCSSCHFKDGRGTPPKSTKEVAAPSFIFRLEENRDTYPIGRLPKPHPRMGRQLQDFGMGLPAEGQVTVRYEETRIHLTDEASLTLRKPTFILSDASFEGDLEPLLSPRIPPTLVGMGLLEAVPDRSLLQNADPEDLDEDGISGRVSRLSGGRIGRFGWKAEQPGLLEMVVTALAEDLGVSSEQYPNSNCGPEDQNCLKHQLGVVEISPEELDQLVGYLRLLAPPARRDGNKPEIKWGEKTFATIGCDRCHRPSLTTGDASEISGPAELARQTIGAFSDLLLHDLGPELAEPGREDRESSREWRTSPLWGLGLLETVNGSLFLLHDGRARSFEEAILWHGGEAEASRQQFVDLDHDERKALVAFLISL